MAIGCTPQDIGRCRCSRHAGMCLAAADGWFQIVPAILCFLFAFLMQIDANFINDFFDYLKGSDREDRLGPERACAQGWITLEAMKRGIALTTMLACVVGALLLFTVEQR